MKSEPSEAVLFGHVFIDSDVQTQPSYPASGAVVIAISVVGWREISEQTGLAPDAMHRARFSIRQEWLTDFAFQSEVDTEGRWLIRLEPGTYVICLANFRGLPNPGGNPISVTGCFPIEDAVVGKTKIEIHAGELGVYGR